MKKIFLTIVLFCTSLIFGQHTAMTKEDANIVTGSISITSLTTGNCMQAGIGGLIATTMSPCSGAPGGSNGQIQGNNAGVFGGMPGSVIDFSNGLLVIAPPGNGVALSLTGDSNNNDILDLYVNGSPSSPIWGITSGGGMLDASGNTPSQNYVPVGQSDGTFLWTPLGIGPNGAVQVSLNGGLSESFSMSVNPSTYFVTIDMSVAGASGSALTIRGDSAGSDLQDWKNNANTIVAKVNLSGALTGTAMTISGCASGTYVKADGTGCGTPSGGGSVTGSGTANTIPLWTSSLALGNSVLTQSSGSISLTNGSSLGNFTLSNGSFRSTLTANDTTAVCSVCAAGQFQSSYTGAGITNFYGINVLSSEVASGTQTNSYGASISAVTTGGTTTNMYGARVGVTYGNGSNSGAIVNNYGLLISSFYQGTSNFTVTNNKAIDVSITAGASGFNITNDYGIYLEPLGLNEISNHSAIYIGDQGADNFANATWFALNIQPQSVGPGFTKPTALINHGGVYEYSGSGAPSFNCGSGSTPSIYYNNTASTASTVMYVCISGTTWTAVTVP